MHIQQNYVAKFIIIWILVEKSTLRFMMMRLKGEFKHICT